MLLTINNKIEKKLKRITLLVMCGISLTNLAGCVYKNKGDYLGEKMRTYDEQSDAMMQLIIDALEAQDAEALKKLLSSHTLEKAEDLNENIEKLMDFYPGSEGGFEGNCISSRGANYGDIVLTLLGTYTVKNDNQEYQIRFVLFPQNDEEPDKTGLYIIEVMTEEAEPEGFKWKNEEDAPGIYILE